VLSFAGTTLEGASGIASDWGNNFGQYVGGVPEQYDRGRALAESLKQQHPDLVITGHSLGGGIAAYAGMATGSETYTFNAAGLGWGARRELEQSGHLAANQHLIHNVNIEGEIVNRTNFGGIAPEQVGHVYEVPDPSADPDHIPEDGNWFEKAWGWAREQFHEVVETVENHMMPPMIDALKQGAPARLAWPE
jgi:putative lipase involved disintegration of autophagic bodies